MLPFFEKNIKYNYFLVRNNTHNPSNVSLPSMYVGV